MRTEIFPAAPDFGYGRPTSGGLKGCRMSSGVGRTAGRGPSGNNSSVLQQYGDGTGDIQYQQTFGGEVVDTNAYPANGCNHNGTGTATPGYPTTFPTPNCLTDDQLTSELSSYVAAHGLPT